MSSGTEPTQGQIKFDSILDYQKTVAQLSEDLNKLLEYSQELALTESAELIRQVLKRVREGRFVVAVVGEFKVGKSTFLNALLGSSVLPMDIVPATAAINRVTYGFENRIVIHFKDNRIEEIGISELSKYVTKIHDQKGELAKTVREAVVYHDAPYLMNNVDIIDTPGLNDEEAMDRATIEVLPRSDAAILLISATQPFSESTRSFLETKLLTSDLGRVIFVVNQLGRLDEAERDRLVQYVEQTVQDRVIGRAKAEYGEGTPEFAVYVKKIGKPKVFGLDARWALEAKQMNEAELLKKSRFEQFRPALEYFLTRDRGAIVLQVPVNRIIASANEVLATLALREGALKLDMKTFNERYEKAVAELEPLRKQKTDQLGMADQMREDVKKSVGPKVNGLKDKIRNAAVSAVQSFALTDTDLSDKTNQEDLIKKLNSAVSTVVRQQSERFGEQIGIEVSRGLSEASEHLKKLTVKVETVVRNLTIDFASTSSEAQSTGIKVFIGSMTPFGAVLSGYEQAGAKGAIWGGIGGFTSVTAAYMLLAAAAVPVAIPVMIAVNLVAWFLGSWIVSWSTAGARAEKFRERFEKELFKTIDRQDIEGDTRQKIFESIDKAFHELKEGVSRELDALINDTQHTLADLKAQKERNVALSEDTAEEYQQMRERTTRILDYADRLNKQLVQILSV